MFFITFIKNLLTPERRASHHTRHGIAGSDAEVDREWMLHIRNANSWNFPHYWG